MEFEKIRNLSDDELKTEQAKAGEQLFRIRFQKRTLPRHPSSVPLARKRRRPNYV
jgi:ribosomal protein L29